MDETPNSRRAKRWRARLETLLEGVALVATLAFIAHYVGAIAREGLLPYDSMRDLASIRHALGGYPFEDPTIAHERIWYPPGQAWLTALACRIIGWTPERALAVTQLVSALLIPTGLHLFARRVIGPRASLLGIIVALLISTWWRVSLASPLPAYVGLFPVFLTAFVYVRRRKPSTRMALGVGATLGLLCVVHPLAPAVVALSLVSEAAVDFVNSAWSKRRPRALAALGCACGLGVGFGAVGLPIVAYISSGPVRNADPRRYIAREIGDVAFLNAGIGALCVLLVGIGVMVASRSRRTGSRALAFAWAISALGTVPGLLVVFNVLPEPPRHFYNPHQFQVLQHLFGGLLVGLTLDRALVALSRTRRARWTMSSALASVGVLLAMAIPGYEAQLRTYLAPNWCAHMGPANEMIASIGSVQDVVAAEPASGMGINACTGRWVVTVASNAHMNTRVDPRERLARLDSMRTAGDLASLRREADLSGVRWILLSAHFAPRALLTATPQQLTAHGMRRAPLPPGAPYLFRLERGPTPTASGAR